MWDMLLVSGGGHKLQGVSGCPRELDKKVAFECFRHMQMIAMKLLLHVLTFESDALLPKLLNEVPE
jgi:hypothetical protein